MRGVLAIVSLLALAGCGSSAAARPTAARAGPPGDFDRSRESRHFVFLWNRHETTDAEVDSAEEQAERLLAELVARLGRERPPRHKIVVALEGDAVTAQGAWRYPFVDLQGRLHLFRFAGQGGGYLGMLGHELVHALRIDWIRSHPDDGWTGFVEEGFAELLATTLEPERPSFPYYGFPPMVVTGGWLESGEAPPLATLRERHRELNIRCLPQSYTLRGSFFRYLERTFGMAAVLELADTDSPITSGLFAEIFGRDFESLAEGWRRWVAAGFEATPDAARLADEYRRQTPIRYMYVCTEGRDY